MSFFKDPAWRSEPKSWQKVLHKQRPDNLRPGRAAKQCACGVWFELPRSHAHRHHSCTAECADKYRRQVKQARQRGCVVCGELFTPRARQVRLGWGIFCSQKCNLSAARQSEAHIAARPRAAAKRKESYSPPKGPDSPTWKGGNEATLQRNAGKRVARNRQYRQENPEKVREWRHQRQGRKHGRLPRGTVASLRVLQRNCCANCRKHLGDKFHLDHIVPLARGGKHERGNVQLLCPTCNLRKSSRDPIAFAQLNGRLI